MSTEKYISELLYTNDCVIIPGFGGFITGVLPSKIHSGYPIIYPPSKSILFNPQLVQNDGLLATAIAAGENISYQDALQWVFATVDNYKLRLRNYHKLMIDKVGIIHSGEEGNLIFEQDLSINYLEESFGLHNFVCLPVQAETPEITTPLNQPQTLPFIPNLTLQQRVYRVGKVVVIPLFLAVGSLFFFQNLVDDPFISYNSFFSIKNEKKSEIPNQKPVQKTVPFEKSRYALLKDNGKNNEPVLKKENVAQAPMIEIQKKVKYYVIGGAFRSVENAEKFAGQLVNKGFHPEIAGQNNAGLTLVSYFTTLDAGEAEQQLSIIQNSENSQAWILEK